MRPRSRKRDSVLVPFPKEKSRKVPARHRYGKNRGSNSRSSRSLGRDSRSSVFVSADEECRRRAIELLRNGFLAEGIEVLLERDSGTVSDLLGWGYFLFGDRAKAASYWEAAGEPLETLAALIKRGGGIEEEVLGTLLNHSSMIVASTAAWLSAENHLKHSRFRRAVASVQKAEWYLPKNKELKKIRLNAALALGENQLAERTAREILALAPDEASAWVSLGDIQVQRRNFEEALLSFEKALEIQPLDVALTRKLARLSEEKGDREKALGYWDRLLALTPSDQEALGKIAWAYFNEEEYEEALHYFRRWYEEGFPRDQEEACFEAYGYLLLEEIFSGRTERIEGAEEFLMGAWEKYPQNPSFQIFLVRLCLFRDDIERGVRILSVLEEHYPDVPEVWYEKAQVYRRRSDWQGMVSSLSRAYRLNPDPFYAVELGSVFLELRDWRKAVQWLRRALSSGEEIPDVLHDLYYAYYKSWDFTRAENALRRVLQMRKSNPKLDFFLAELFFLKGEYEQAFEKFEVLRERLRRRNFRRDPSLEPFLTSVEWHLGFAGLATRRFSLAKRAFQRAFELPGIEEIFHPALFERLRRLVSEGELSEDLKASILAKIRGWEEEEKKRTKTEGKTASERKNRRGRKGDV